MKKKHPAHHHRVKAARDKNSRWLVPFAVVFLIAGILYSFSSLKSASRVMRAKNVSADTCSGIPKSMVAMRRGCPSGWRHVRFSCTDGTQGEFTAETCVERTELEKAAASVCSQIACRQAQPTLAPELPSEDTPAPEPEVSPSETEGDADFSQQTDETAPIEESVQEAPVDESGISGEESFEGF